MCVTVDGDALDANGRVSRCACSFCLVIAMGANYSVRVDGDDVVRHVDWHDQEKLCNYFCLSLYTGKV